MTGGGERDGFKIGRSCPKTRFATVRRAEDTNRVAIDGPIEGEVHLKLGHVETLRGREEGEPKRCSLQSGF